jgi:hypothetical protein
MLKVRLACTAALALSLAAAGTASAQTQPSTSDSGWTFSIYPIFVWVPLGIDISVDLPPVDGGGSGSIVDGRFDGAYFGGIVAERGRFRIDADGIWAGFGGDRLELPNLTVDTDLIYFHVTGGVKVAPDFFVNGGVRRLALKYNITLGTRPEFERKPGLWDPVVGVGYHPRVTERLQLHAGFEVGGFGVGSDIDTAALFRFDWKPLRHFGLTAGYHFLYLKFSDDESAREFVVKQTLHGPIVGIGLYF